MYKIIIGSGGAKILLYTEIKTEVVFLHKWSCLYSLLSSQDEGKRTPMTSPERLPLHRVIWKDSFLCYKMKSRNGGRGRVC